MDEKNLLDEKLEKLITAKLDSALAPIVEKLNDMSKVEATPKLDATEELAKALLREKLKGIFPSEKLDSYSLEQLKLANEMKLEVEPILNEPKGKSEKLDATPDMWGVHFERAA